MKIGNNISGIPVKGLFINDWLWMEEYAFVSLKRTNKPTIGDTCIWWNEI